MLEAIERMARVTDVPLSAQPNAGMPRSVEGRNIYLCSPEYMASYTKKFAAAGVRLIGGCCGTTPDHIRSMKSALRVGEARTTSFQVVTKPKTAKVIEPKPIAERSAMGKKIANGAF